MGGRIIRDHLSPTPIHDDEDTSATSHGRHGSVHA